MYTSELITGGFKILKDGVVVIHQPFDFRQPGFVPVPEQDRQALADAVIAEMTASDEAQAAQAE